MSTLTEIYATTIEKQDGEWQTLQEKKAAAEAARAGARAALLRSYLAKWEPLCGLLGLKGQPVLEEGKGRMVIRGQSSINGLAVVTMAYVSLWYSSEFPNLELTICAQEDLSISNGIGIPYNLPADQYAERMGALCTIWMELYRNEMARRTAAAATLAKATDTAERVLDLARRYMAAWQAHQLESRD